MTNKLLKELMDLPLTDFGNALRLQAIFGKPYLVATRPHCWNRAEVENITEDEFRIMAMVMKAMVNKGLIKPSKSRAMFKILF